jgi:16S rRNA (guanine527-N7)-methyltransferase
MSDDPAHTRLEALVAEYHLPAAAVTQLATILDLVATEPTSITTIRDPAHAVEAHVADSLAGLALAPLRSARTIADLGSGGGFPGLVLAAALPAAQVALVESVSKKCAFLTRAADAAGLPNVTVVNARAEEWDAGRDGHDLVTARALAPLNVILEYAAPLLAVGGSVVAWKGRRDPAEELDGAAAAAHLGLSAPAAVGVPPRPGAEERHLYLSSKVTETPSSYPRRAGMARKRPIRASSGG